MLRVWRSPEIRPTMDIDMLGRTNNDESLGIPVRGTLGIVLLARKQSVIPEASPILKQMVDAGFRIAPEMLETALKLVGESVDPYGRSFSR